MANNFQCDSYKVKHIDGLEYFKCACVTNAGIRPCEVKWMGCYRLFNCEYCKNRDNTEMCLDCEFHAEETEANIRELEES